MLTQVMIIGLNDLPPCRSTGVGRLGNPSKRGYRHRYHMGNNRKPGPAAPAVTARAAYEGKAINNHNINIKKRTEMKGQVTDGQWTVTAEKVLNYVLSEISLLRWSYSDLAFAEKSARFEAIISMYRGLASAALIATDEGKRNDQAEAATGTIADEEQADTSSVSVMEAQ